MAAYFSASTVVGSILLLLASMAAMLSTLGGMNQPLLRDIPWMTGSYKIEVGTISATAMPFWMGLWNYCIQDVLNGVHCQPLVNGTSNQLDLMTGKSTIADENNLAASGIPAPLVVALPYIAAGASALIFMVFILSFLISPPAAAGWSFLATVGQGAAFGCGLYFVMAVRQKMDNNYSFGKMLADLATSEGVKSAFGSQQGNGLSLWISMAATAACLFAFFFFAASACSGNWKERRAYRSSIYY
jgi:hypothetical protein